MTNQEWKRRCVERIFRAVKNAGRVRLRELKRATHYNRGPQDESIPLWYEALDFLERGKRIVVERDADGVEIFAATPEAFAVLGAVVTPTNYVTDGKPGGIEL
jgi:hypothetical protein